MQTTSNEDAEEINNDRTLLELITHDTEGLDPQQAEQGMNKVRSEENLADILTKFVSCDTLNKHLYTVGL